MNLIQRRLPQMSGKWCGLLIVFCLLLGGSMIARAQSSSTGDIRGTVTDSTGAVIPGATVLVVNVATGEEKSFTTNRDGLYDTVSTQNGHYTVAIMAPGFEKLVLGPITLDIGTITLNGKLRVGSALQEVVVSADVARCCAPRAASSRPRSTRRQCSSCRRSDRTGRTLRSCCRAVRAHLHGQFSHQSRGVGFSQRQPTLQRQLSLRRRFGDKPT